MSESTKVMNVRWVDHKNGNHSQLYVGEKPLQVFIDKEQAEDSKFTAYADTYLTSEETGDISLYETLQEAKQAVEEALGIRDGGTNV